jgi:hypothetical protein
VLLEDNDKEIMRLKDQSSRCVSDNGLLRREIDKIMGEAFDARKEGEYQ